jgi:hypothetical protein
MGVGDRVHRTEEVRPAHRANEQRAPGQEQERLVGPRQVGRGVGHVLGRVARRVEDREPDRPHVDRVTAPSRLVVVAECRPGPDHVRGAGQGRQLAAARDVVVVQVGLEDMGDAEVRVAGGVEVDIDVPPRIDDGGDASRLVRDQGREMSQPLDPELRQAHGRSLHLAHDRPGHPGQRAITPKEGSG